MNHWKGKTTQLSSLKSSWHQPHYQYFEAPAGTSPPCPPLSQPSHREYGRCSPPPSSQSPPSQNQSPSFCHMAKHIRCHQPWAPPPTAPGLVPAAFWVLRGRGGKPGPPGCSWELPWHCPMVWEGTSLRLPPRCTSLK